MNNDILHVFENNFTEFVILYNLLKAKLNNLYEDYKIKMLKYNDYQKINKILTVYNSPNTNINQCGGYYKNYYVKITDLDTIINKYVQEYRILQCAYNNIKNEIKDLDDKITKIKNEITTLEENLKKTSLTKYDEYYQEKNRILDSLFQKIQKTSHYEDYLQRNKYYYLFVINYSFIVQIMDFFCKYKFLRIWCYKNDKLERIQSGGGNFDKSKHIILIISPDNYILDKDFIDFINMNLKNICTENHYIGHDVNLKIISKSKTPEDLINNIISNLESCED